MPLSHRGRMMGGGLIPAGSSDFMDDFESGSFGTDFYWPTPANWIITTPGKDSSYCIRSAAITHNQQTEVFFPFIFDVDGYIEYDIKVGSEPNLDLCRFYINGALQETLSGNVDWTKKTVNLAAGAYIFSWLYSKDISASYAPDCAFLDNIVISGPTKKHTLVAKEDFETGSFSVFSWLGNWSVVSGGFGSYCAQAATIAGNQSTSMYFTYTTAADGFIIFDYSTSSETNYDKLKFYIDDVQQAEYSGITPWRSKAVFVSAGEHTFRWTYSKDGSGNGGSDTVWVDNIAIITF